MTAVAVVTKRLWVLGDCESAGPAAGSWAVSLRPGGVSAGRTCCESLGASWAGPASMAESILCHCSRLASSVYSVACFCLLIATRLSLHCCLEAWLVQAQQRAPSSRGDETESRGIKFMGKSSSFVEDVILLLGSPIKLTKPLNYGK